MNLLIVDDSDIVRQRVKQILSGEGVEVHEADCGERGVEMLESQPFDLVLCDVHMPGISGLELVEQVLSQPRFSELPIVMLTASSDWDSITRAREAGIKGWLIKPFEPESLVFLVRRISARAA